MSKTRKYIFWILFLEVFIEFVNGYYYLFAKTGMPGFKVYALLHQPLIAMYFAYLFRGSILSKLAGISGIGYIVFWFWVLAQESLEEWVYYSALNIVGNVMIIFLSLLFLFKTFFESKIRNLTQDLNFWTVSALFVMNGSMFFCSLTDSYILIEFEQTHYRMYLVLLYLVSNILLCTILSIGLWKTRRILSY